jgi:hemolysin activation/secretion protein
MTGRLTPFFTTYGRSRDILLSLILGCLIWGTASSAAAAGTASSPSSATTGSSLYYYVRGYTVEGILLPTNILTPLFSKYTGTNVSLEQIVHAASELQSAYRDQGYPAVSVAFVPEEIRDGIVTFNVAQTAIPQIVVAGERCLGFSNGVEIVSQPPAAVAKPSVVPAAAVVAPATIAAISQASNVPTRRANHAEMAEAMTALQLKMAELEKQAKDTRVHVVSTNAGPRFEVRKYLVDGNSILPLAALGRAITNIDGAFGTNVSFDGIQAVVTELGKAYHDRGYVTVAVNVPQQKLTNATVKLQVLEGRLADIKVIGNHYYSSNNVMRALPSLHTNMVLNGPIFSDELNRANANQNRQIYPVIGPGPGPGTSELTLNVKDRLPLHAKAEFDNQNSPGTPNLRVNTSAVYDNLWQAEHSLGVQYGFSPGQYKQGDQWNFYDLPAVAYYSGFYRLPVGNPERVENTVANNPGNFGYNEATRQFNLPPPTGQSELTLYASRATIDTGVENLGNTQIFPAPPAPPNGIFGINEEAVQQDITINEDAGFRLTKPLRQMDGVSSLLAGGLDYKVYNEDSYKTNSFITSEVTFDPNGNPLPPIITTVPSPTTTLSTLDYLPLELDYNANLQDAFGPATWGLGLIANLWYTSAFSTATAATTFPTLHGVDGLQAMTGSTQSTGHWVILRPSFSQNVSFYTNWITSLRADGQWASEPLVSPEQFGAGGVNSVRGYHEGEVFGDAGWHVSLEQQTPVHVVGTVYDGALLTVRGSIYMDYACVYLNDPRGRQQNTPLWGTGFGFAAGVGSHWQTQLLFSWPLLTAGTTTAYQPRFNFSISGQF